MNIKNNKGITLVGLTITVVVLLILTGAMLYNTKNHIDMKKVQNLYTDIELLNAKVDDYYLRYGELPKLCDYSNYSNFLSGLEERANNNGADFNTDVNKYDGNNYIVIDLEKLEGITLNYGYDSKGTDGRDGKTGEYFAIKQSGHLKNYSDNANKYEDEIYVINTKTHQIYFPHGVFADNLMYFTLDNKF